MNPTTDWKKRFDEEFTYGVLLSASSDLSAGKDIRFKADYHPNVIKKFIESEISKAEARGRQQNRDAFTNRWIEEAEKKGEASGLCAAMVAIETALDKKDAYKEVERLYFTAYTLASLEEDKGEDAN